MAANYLKHFQDRIADQLANDARSGRARQRQKLSTPNARQVVFNGRTLLNFSSHDYLGLGHHPLVKHAVSEAVARDGAGGAASALVSGYRPAHAQLEQAVAAFTGRDAALIFPTTYMANLAVLSTLFGRDDVILADRQNHASLNDAAVLSRAQIRRYPHADIAGLGEQLADAGQAGLRCVVTDGVFGVNGDLAPLSQIVDVAADRAIVMVDDAHGIGVMGQQGRGTVAGYGFTQAQVPLLVGAFGKALGGNGAFVAGESALIELLAQRAHPYIYTTALAPSSVAAVQTSLELLQSDSDLQDRLQHNLLTFRRQLLADNIPLLPSQTPIQPVLVGQTSAALAVRDFLISRGCWVQALHAPIVPQGAARLRITLNSAHTVDDILALAGALSQAHSEGLFEAAPVVGRHWGETVSEIESDTSSAMDHELCLE